MRIVLATHNRHKVEEMRAILADSSDDLTDRFEILSLEDFPEIGEIIEDGATLEENARKKARTVFEKTLLVSLADDTGLEVDSLGGRPGVYSARYSGKGASYLKNNQKLLKELSGVPTSKRSATFRCVISIIGDNIDEIAVGEVKGKIGSEMRGENGFGYDPLFIPDGYEITYAEIGSKIKNRISHRSLALEQAKTILRQLVS